MQLLYSSITRVVEVRLRRLLDIGPMLDCRLPKLLHNRHLDTAYCLYVDTHLLYQEGSQGRTESSSARLM